MVTLSYIIWGASLLGNAILLFLLSWREWYIRYNWLTISVAASIVVDLLLMRAHSQSHPLYEPIRIFVFYALFYVLDVAVIWEAWRLRDKRVRVPVEIQLALSLTALLAKHTQFVLVAYFIECSLRWINLCVIIWFISIFRKEIDYGRYHSAQHEQSR